MKRIQCEMCSGTDLVKENGMYICQNCGTKYTVEEAQKLIVEVDNDSQRERDLAKLRSLKTKMEAPEKILAEGKKLSSKISSIKNKIHNPSYNSLPTNNVVKINNSINDSVERKRNNVNNHFKSGNTALSFFYRFIYTVLSLIPVGFIIYFVLKYTNLNLRGWIVLGVYLGGLFIFHTVSFHVNLSCVDKAHYKSLAIIAVINGILIYFSCTKTALFPELIGIIKGTGAPSSNRYFLIGLLGITFVYLFILYFIMLPLYGLIESRHDKKSDKKKAKIIDSYRAELKAKHKEELEKAKALDAENNEKNREREKEAQKQNLEKYADELKDLEEQKKKNDSEYRKALAEIDNDTTLDKQDKNTVTIDFLIDRLNSRRADSIKEALLQLDEKTQREAKEAFENWQREFDREQERWERKQEKERQSQRDLDNYMHQLRMEDLERERISEVKKVRDEIKDLKR